MSELDINAIRDYLVKVGCKIEYPILVNAFKQHLYNPDPKVQGKIRTQFKDYVNGLATVSLENNMKFIILRPEFMPKQNPDFGKQKPQPPQLQEPKQPKQLQEPKHHNESQQIQHPQTPQQPSDKLRRKWAIEACNCNFRGLVTLLREDPKLATHRDIVNGYTALHWAAKFGNLNIIKLMAGIQGVSSNIKSSAGYTPLHVAYMFGRNEAADLLLKTFRADPQIRDHSGKRPMQYCRQRPSK